MTKEQTAAEHLTDPQGETDLKIDVQNIVGEVNDQAAVLGGEFDQFSQTEKKDEPVISEEMAAMILKLPFSMAAGVWGDFWELRQSEVDLMKAPGAKVFSDLFGRYMGSYPEATMLCITLLIAAAPRAAITAKIKKEQKRPKEVKPEEVGEQLNVE